MNKQSPPTCVHVCMCGCVRGGGGRHLGRVEGVDKDEPVQLCLEETTKAHNVHKGLDLSSPVLESECLDS